MPAVPESEPEAPVKAAQEPLPTSSPASSSAVPPVASAEVAASAGRAGDEADTDHAVVPPVPRVSGQPLFTVVAEEHGASRVHAFARRWRAFLYHQERQRPWLAPHDLCASACTGLTSRCVRAMEREGFLCAIRPPAPPAAK